MAIEFDAGTTVGEAADELASRSQKSGQRLNAEFNGTPMVAIPGDSARHVLERWRLERAIYQMSRGIDPNP